MTRLYSPLTLAVVGALVTAVLLASPNAELWAATVLMLPVAIWLLGGKQAYPVLVWLIGLNWLQIVGDVLEADLSGRTMSDGWLGQYRAQAIYFSLCAIASMALGMRCGTRLGGSIFGSGVHPGAASLAADKGSVSIHRIVAAYFISLALYQALAAFAFMVPMLTQPIIALGLVKFVCVYLVAAKVFASERGYHWLLLISLFELAIGVVGFFASYKEAVFVMLIALAASRTAMSMRKWIFAGVAVVIVVWMSLVWTAIKQEYRAQVFSNPLEQRAEWLAQRFLVNTIDYGGAVIKLVQRIGYTEFYAQLLARVDIGSIPRNLNRYGAAVQHVLTPRVLFPDKPKLDDSRLTTELLGIEISSDTSIGIGFVAEAHVDFGFPGLLLPLLLLGAMIGSGAQYFMTRPAPPLIQEAFTTASLFLSFPFAANIDKALGGFITGCLAMALALKFGYPMIAQWLAVGRAGRRINVDRAAGRMSI
jgi:hypothetical protein